MPLPPREKRRLIPFEVWQDRGTLRNSPTLYLSEGYSRLYQTRLPILGHPARIARSPIASNSSTPHPIVGAGGFLSNHPRSASVRSFRRARNPSLNGVSSRSV